MKESLYNQLKKYKNLERSSFHTPGHKGHFFSRYNLNSLDFTELPATDSLYEASGAIKLAENRVSKLYGSESSFFSAGGNTLCIQAMIRMCCRAGDKILCDRIVHRSVVSAMGLLNVTPVWVKRLVDKSTGLASQIDIPDLKFKLKANPDVKAIYLTSPSYYGVLQDLKLISEICRRKGVLVLVDNAHGSHLKFLGLHPLDQGADLVSDSAHKTLPVLTGGAWLHVNKKEFKNTAKSAMALFGSTSPSYPVMASLDIACGWLEKNGFKEYKRLKCRVEEINEIARRKNIFLASDSHFCDPTRIALGTYSIGYSGFEFRKLLYKFKIEPELCDENYVVLIPSPHNILTDWQRLKLALESIEAKEPKTIDLKFEKTPIPPAKATISEAILGESTQIGINECLNKIAAEVICPCPPGIPVVMPGEVIGTFEQQALKYYGAKEINVIK